MKKTWSKKSRETVPLNPAHAVQEYHNGGPEHGGNNSTARADFLQELQAYGAQHHHLSVGRGSASEYGNSQEHKRALSHLSYCIELWRIFPAGLMISSPN